MQQVMRAVGHNPQVPRLQGPAFGQEVQCLLLAVKKPAGDLQEVLASRRQRHLLSLPVEQQNVVFLFKLPDLIRDRGLGQEQLFCRAGKPATGGDVVKGAKLNVAHKVSIRIYGIIKSNDLNYGLQRRSLRDHHLRGSSCIRS